jgi:hypothetical protein
MQVHAGVMMHVHVTCITTHDLYDEAAGVAATASASGHRDGAT